MNAVSSVILAGLIGAQAASDAGLSQRARTLQPLQTHFSTDDYPEAAIERRAEGIVRFTLEIDSRGVPARCTIDESSRDPALDSRTCEILMGRARFSAARDEQGRPAADRISSRVRWALPEPVTMPVETTRYVSTMRVTAGGQVSCSTNEPEAEDVEGADPRECGAFIGTGAVAYLRALGADVGLTQIRSMIPEGRPDPDTGALGYGNRMVSSEAILTIAADGRVTGCQMVSHEFDAASFGPNPPHRICDEWIGTDPMFEAARDGAAERRMRVRWSVHLRR